jgi:hypothetical protein
MKFYPRVTRESHREILEMETDLEERLTGDNLLEPLLFEEGEIDLFIRDNKCGFCGGYLFKRFAPDRKYTANCPEHGEVFEHTKTSEYVAEEVVRNTRVAKNELRQPEKPRPESVILKELGF